MNNLQIFKNAEFGEIRTVEFNNEIWFVASDIAKSLGYRMASDMTRNLDTDDTDTQKVSTLGGSQNMTVINESGLYSAILSSKLPKAKEFKHWVTSEVLPSIRKHGAYMTPETLEQAILNPDTMIKLCTALKNEQDKNKELQAVNSSLTVDNQIMKPKADYFDELVDRNLLTNFRETAKQLEIKEKEFVKFLIERKFVYRDERGKLMPYADKNNGLFEVKETFNEKTKWSGTQTLITPKGRETFRLLFLKYSA